MANTILGLAMKVTADASSVPKSLTQAERAFERLSQQVERSTAVFAPFAERSGAAARAQEQFAERFARLADQLREKAIGPKEYAAAFAQLTEEAKTTAAAFDEGLRVTDRARTAEERRAVELQRLQELLELGAVDQETFARASAEASGANELAAKAEKERADAMAAAARIIQANLTPQEKYDQQVRELTSHLDAGRLSQEQFDRALASATAAFTKAESAAKGYDKAAEAAGDAGALKFNELSGILSALPGPIGNVAGRLSGLASAGEGLGRVFSGGLSAGISGIGASVAALVNPFTLAAAGIAGVGAAATAVVSGLSSLEAETEKLQNAADKLGVSFGFMETLSQAAEMSGVSFDSVNSAMTRLLKTLAGADEESKQATAALGRLGVSLDDINGKSSEEQLKLIAERLQAIEDPAKRAAAATAIFGKSGADILPFFQNLGIAEQTLTRFNARLSEIDVGRVLALGDSFDAVKASLTGVGNELLTPFIGITQSLSDGLASAIATFGRNIGAILDIFSPLTSAVGLAGNAFLQFGSVIGNLVGTVFEPFAAGGRVISGALDTISRAVTAVAGRINDAIIGFREFFKFEGVAAGFSQAFAQIGETVSRVAVIVTEFAQVVGEGIGRVGAVIGEGVTQFLEFTGLESVISSFASTIGAAFGTLWDTIKGIVSGIGGFIERVLQFAEDWLGIKRDVEQPVEAVIEVNDNGALNDLIAESKTLGTTIDSITKSVSDAINESSKFGEAGFDAALQYQQAIDDLKDKLAAGLFNEETFRREAAKAGEAYKAEIDRLQEQTKFDLQESEETKKTLDNLQAQINKAGEAAQQFGQAGFDAAAQFQGKLRELGQQFEDGRINAATLAQETAKATSEYEKQIEGFRQIEELQKNIAAADKQRLDQIVAAQSDAAQGETDLEFVLRQQKQLEEEINQARREGAVIAADAAAARLAQLDQIEAKLIDQEQAVEQGFTEGFARAFEGTDKSIQGLIEKAQQFGNTGALAFEALRAGVERAQQQAQGGILTAETYQQEVARQQELFNQRLAAAQRVEDFLAARLNDRQRAELEAVKQLEERKKQAAVNVQALEAKILTEQKAIEAARKGGNLADARAGVQRLNQLNQAKRAEQQIANGREQANRQQAQQLQQGNSAAQQFQSLIGRQNEAFLKGFQDAYAGANNALAQGARVAEEQARRLEMLRPTNATVNVADIRTAEGQALVQDVAAQAQDPALIEARQQTRLLNAIAQGITGAASNFFNQPVAIVGAARMG